jgi:hypothetical protein
MVCARERACWSKRSALKSSERMGSSIGRETRKEKGKREWNRRETFAGTDHFEGFHPYLESKK